MGTTCLGNELTTQSSPWLFFNFVLFVYLLLHFVSSFPFPNILYKKLAIVSEEVFPVVAWNISSKIYWNDWILLSISSSKYRAERRLRRHCVSFLGRRHNDQQLPPSISVVQHFKHDFERAKKIEDSSNFKTFCAQMLQITSRFDLEKKGCG